MKRAAIVLLFLITLGLAYMILWPVPIDPAPWSPPEAPELQGAFAPNDRVAGVERLGEGAANAPEDIAIDSAGRIYGGMLDGRIVRWPADLAKHEVFAETGGRPLGLHFDAEDNLIVADAVKGLLSIDPQGQAVTLSTEEGGRPFAFVDDVDIGKDGTIYFSDASDRFSFDNFVADLLEHQPNGRLLAYDPASGQTRLLLDQLYFANGVAVSPDQEFVLVVETGMYRIQRYWLAGEKAGTAEIFIDNLPGFPDGVSAGSNGIFWVAIASPRDPLLDRLMPAPFLRKVVYRLPKALQPAAKHHSFVLGLDESGAIVHNLQDPAGAFAPITSVQEHAGMLYFGSIEEPAFARMPRPQDMADASAGGRS